MQNYINQLLADLKAAQAHQRPPKMELPPELEFVRGAEEFLHGPRSTFGKLFGIEKMVFPPVEKLSDGQQEILVQAITDLWMAFNFSPEFPEALPLEHKYRLLVGVWDEEASYVSEGINHYDFCTYDSDSCPYPEGFCTCKEFDDDYDSLNKPLLENKPGELPF